MDFDPRDSTDPRERDEGIYGSRSTESDRDRDSLDRDEDVRDHDPRDPFVRTVDLPWGVERELVQDTRERLYELNGDDSRMLATMGAFRVVAEGDVEGFRDAANSLEHLREEGLIRSVSVGHDQEAFVLTDAG
jgi:hypothetical protein